MAEVLYRPVRETEIAETAEVFLVAVTDMYARHGILQPPPRTETIETGYRHIFETGIFYVAEVDGRIAAICHAVVRESLWFLSGFWMLPQFQRQGIGGALLKIVQDEGARAGASTFFTWSSVDQTAMASYMRRGMLPGYQILTFAGALNERQEQRDGYEVQPLDISNAVALDRRVRATGREVDHKFWLTKSGHQGRQIMLDGRAVGYFYFNHGVVGPAAWSEMADAEALIAAACREASLDGEEVRMMIPGINHTAIRFALGAGLRLRGFSHLLTSAPFGILEQYLASGPLLF
jgi:GNAT superfamily N-acetyltransferase